MVVQLGGAARRAHAGRGQRILDRDWHAMQRAEVTACRSFRIRRVGFAARTLEVERDDGVELRVDALDALDQPFEQRAACQFTAAYGGGLPHG